MGRYHNGNDTDENQLRGFGHIGFLVDDLDAACADLESKGVVFKKKPADGVMRGLAFAYDPDNYWCDTLALTLAMKCRPALLFSRSHAVLIHILIVFPPPPIDRRHFVCFLSYRVEIIQRGVAMNV